eukprot:127623-Pelagomonas_calceolata.AAC.6
MVQGYGLGHFLAEGALHGCPLPTFRVLTGNACMSAGYHNHGVLNVGACMSIGYEVKGYGSRFGPPPCQRSP